MLYYHFMVQLPFSERWKLLEEEVVRPRNNERKQFECEGKCNSIYRYDMEPFSVSKSKIVQLVHIFFQYLLILHIFFIYVIYVKKKLSRLGGRTSGCYLLLLSFWRSSFRSFHMQLMALYFRYSIIKGCFVIFMSNKTNHAVFPSALLSLVHFNWLKFDSA